MYTVIPTERFDKDVKYYIRKKGFVHIGADIKVVTDELQKGNLKIKKYSKIVFVKYIYIIIPDL